MIAMGVIAYTDYAIDARVIRMAEAASVHGYAVDLFAPRKRGAKRREVLNRVTVHRLAVRPFGGRTGAGYVLSYLNFFIQCFVVVSIFQLKRRYRIIHVHNMPDFLVFSASLAKLLGAKIILDIHDPMAELYLAKFPAKAKGLVYRMLLLQERWSAAFSTKVLTVHEPLKRDVLAKDGINPVKTFVVANFPDDSIFRPLERFSISDRVRMVYYGTIDTRFGLEQALESLARVERRESLYLRIIGEGDCQSSIKRTIRELGLESIVEFENRVYPLHRMPDILASFHLGLVPYLQSPATRYMLPVKLVELMAMGIPAITVANVPIRHYFAESMYFAYNPERSGSLTDLLTRILENPGLVLEKRRAILDSHHRLLWTHERAKYLEILGNL